MIVKVQSCDSVTFPLPLITAFIVTVDDTLTWGWGRAIERDSET